MFGACTSLTARANPAVFVDVAVQHILIFIINFVTAIAAKSAGTFTEWGVVSLFSSVSHDKTSLFSVFILLKQ